jgi:hypothetical protein
VSVWRCCGSCTPRGRTQARPAVEETIKKLQQIAASLSPERIAQASLTDCWALAEDLALPEAAAPSQRVVDSGGERVAGEEARSNRRRSNLSWFRRVVD